MRNTNIVRQSRSVAAELKIQMERAVRPAEAGFKAADSRFAAVEAESLRAEAAFAAADAAFQRVVSKKAEAAEVEVVDQARRAVLAAKRAAAKRLATEREARSRALSRLETAQAHAARLQVRVKTEAEARKAAETRECEQSVLVEALRRAGVDPIRARRAAAAPVGKPSAAPAPQHSRRAKAEDAPREQPKLKLGRLADRWGASVLNK